MTPPNLDPQEGDAELEPRQMTGMKKDNAAFHIAVLFIICYFAFIFTVLIKGIDSSLESFVKDVTSNLNMSTIVILTFFFGAAYGSGMFGKK